MNLPSARRILASHPLQISRQWLRGAIDAVVEAPDALAWIVFAAVASNTLAFVLMFSNPVIQADTWYVTSTFIQKALEHSLHLGDFFAQRGGADHAQPFRRFLLLINLRYYHLDLRYQALAGWAGALLSLLLLRWLVFRDRGTNRASRGVRVWIWAALCVALTSLNGTNLWTWPLAASAFTSYVFMFAALIGLWRWLKAGAPVVLVVSALLLDFAADDTAILINIACLIALGVTAWQNPPLRRRAIQGAAMLLACLVVVRISYALLFTPPDVVRMAFDERMSHLWTAFLDGGWWQWAIIPLASSISMIVSLEYFIGDAALTVQIVIGCALLLAHLWFWWRVLWKRPAMTASMFAAIVLMLVYYAFLAGILYARVSIHGNDYLNQTRYTVLYSFNLIALLLMCASCRWHTPTIPAVARPGFVMLLALFIAWQVPLSNHIWTKGQYKKPFHQKMAWQLGQIARHPERVPRHCLPHLIICQYPADKRARVIGMLQSHRLNVFSPALQRTTGLDPDRPPKKREKKCHEHCGTSANAPHRPPASATRQPVHE